ncbi:glycosyltransferase family 4 protein [Constantimarinum furrinae]|uniref:Glycosyl transferases group 1 n=1 Tax=Constantimarinum furrinae TaxID=2562285 RepID=A0A7G8PQT6_9FLAO|nr:glycosyltransferase family 4 protein [Constantimarinum furrinae]QNJ96702.1 Glycosyl transferases group 1 [Constantimarinum furrinae]
MSEIKTILLCQYPMPLNRIASWTNMYNYYLRNSLHNFDFIVCPEDDEKAEGVTYSYIKPTNFPEAIKNRLDKKNRFAHYFKALDAVLEPNQKYIIHIIDHSGLIAPLNTHLETHYDRKDFYIQYYFQGFDVLYKDERAESFLGGIDEMFFLTQMSYQLYKSYYYELTMRAGVMHNTTDSKLFHTIPSEEKTSLKDALGIKAKLVFLWCSQDRPKKGLHIILDVWKRVYSGNAAEMQLLIVGTNTEVDLDGVTVVGRVPNATLPQYYQVSDFYLFSTLCKEGFGIVLAEALKCGCYCIASDQGGVKEVLANGDYGKLIENPNFIDEWVRVIKESMHEYVANNYQNPFYRPEFEKLYDLDDWCAKMNHKIAEAKKNMV